MSQRWDDPAPDDWTDWHTVAGIPDTEWPWTRAVLIAAAVIGLLLGVFVPWDSMPWNAPLNAPPAVTAPPTP